MADRQGGGVARRVSRLRLVGAVLAGIAVLSWSAVQRGSQPGRVARRAQAPAAGRDGDNGIFGTSVRDYEHEDMNLGDAGLVLLGAFALLAIVPFVIWASYPRSVSDVSRHLTIHPPSPELQIDPAKDLQRFRSAVDVRLDSYGWVDKAKGIVHVPVDQAMRSLARSGVPGFPKAQP